MKLTRSAVLGLTITTIAGMVMAQPGENPPKPTPAAKAPAKSVQPVQPVQPVPSENDGGLLFADPTIKFEKMEFDFGKIFDSEPVEAEFKFTNTGGGALVITNVQTSCGCTTPDWDKQRKQYNAGESGVIKARFDPAHKSGMQTKTITVECNDRTNPRVVLSIKTHITPLVQLEPTYVAFEPVQKGTTATKIVKVTGRKDDFAVTKVTVNPSDVFAARVLGTKKVEVNGEMLPQSEIEVTVKPGAPVGRVSATIQIETNEARSKPMPLGLSGEVAGELTVTPNQLLLGVVAPGAKFSGEVKVTRRDGKPWILKASDLRSPNNDGGKLDITVKAEPTEKNDGQKFTISGVAPDVAGYRYNGELVLSTDVPGEETVRVRVMMTVRPNPGTPGSPASPGGAPATKVTPQTPGKGVKPDRGTAPAGGVPGAGDPAAKPTATPGGTPK